MTMDVGGVPCMTPALWPSNPFISYGGASCNMRKEYVSFISSLRWLQLRAATETPSLSPKDTAYQYPPLAWLP